MTPQHSQALLVCDRTARDHNGHGTAIPQFENSTRRLLRPSSDHTRLTGSADQRAPSRTRVEAA